MNKKLKAAAAAIISAAIAVTSSCGVIVWNDPDAESTTTAAAETEATAETAQITTEASGVDSETEAEPERDLHAEMLARLEELPLRDFSATNILLVTASKNTVAPIIESVESASETITARALAARAVEERYGTRIISVEKSTEQIRSEALEAHAADMYYADLLVVPQSSVGALHAAGLLANMNSLPFADYDADWYDSMTKAALLGNELKAVMGAASFEPDSLTGIYFDRSQAEASSLDLYSLVREGAWTLEKLLECEKSASGVGLSSSLGRDDFIDRFVLASDMEFVTSMKGQLPTLDYMKDGALSALAEGLVDTLYELLYKGSPKLSTESLSFAQGEELMRLASLSEIPELADESVRWGILPLPKYSESQKEYLTPISKDAPVFCALASTPDYEKPGLILEALNVVCYDYISDVYMNEAIDHYLRDEGSIEMLERILESRTTDFAAIFASGISSLENATYGAIRKAVTSRSSLETTYSSHAALAEAALAKSTVIR